MIMTGANTSVNPKFLSDVGLQQAQNYASLQRGEPSVLATSTARTNFETKIQPKIDTANKAIKGVTQVQNKQSQQTQNQQSDIPTELLNEDETPEQKINREYIGRLDKQIENVKNVFNTSIFSQQTNAQGQINSLNRQLTERKSLMQESFNRGIRGTETALQRSGISRYSPMSAESFITMKEQEGINEISKLDQEYNYKVADINQALESNTMSLAAQLTQELGNIEEKALYLIKEQAKESNKINREIKTDNAVFNAINSGYSTIEEIFEASGKTLTTKEIKESLERFLPPEEDSKGFEEKLTGDAKDYFILKNIPGALPSGVNNLFDYIKLKGAAGREPKTITQTGSGVGVTDVPGIGKDTTGAINDALEGMKFATVDARKRADEAIRTKLLNGDVNGAKNLVMQYAKNSFGETNSQVIIGYEQGLQSLNKVENGLQQLENAGIDTGIFTNISQKSLEKIGKADYDSINKKITDPALARMANDIALSIISFRRAVSGAAFTESEGKAYESVFPSIGKDKELNAAKIASLRENFLTGSDAYFRFRINGYDELFKTDNINSDVTPIVPANQQVKGLYTKNPKLQPTVNSMVEDGYSWEDILQVLTSK